MFIASIMSSKSKQSDKKSSSKKSRKKTAASTTLNLSPVVEVGEDDDNIIIDNNNYYHHRRRQLGERRNLGVGPLPFSSDDDGIKQQPSNRSYRYRLDATTNDHNLPSSAVMSSPPPSPGMIYCQNIIIADDTQTERLNVDVATDSSAGDLDSHFPLTSFEEADLLQRAIERRAYLHDKIVAMEAAKAHLVGEGGNTSSSQRRWENHNNNYPRRKSQSVVVPAEIIQYPTSPQQGEDDGRQQTSSTRQHQRQLSHPQREEETAKRLETSIRYQSTSMRHPPPTATDIQSSRVRVMDDRLGYNLQNKYRSFDEVCEDSSGGGGRGEGNETRNDTNNNVARSGTNTPKRRMSKNHHHQRMTEISERIKKEALEFMSYESSYAERKDRLSQQLDGARQSKEGSSSDNDHSGIYDSSEHDTNGLLDNDKMGSDHADDENDIPASTLTNGRYHTFGPAHDSPMIAGKQQRSSPSKVDSAATIDSSAWSGGHPTTHQLSRYSNMVRLGIPDAAVIRSMERDGMSNSQSLLQSLKEEYRIPLHSSTSDTLESSSSFVIQYVRQSSLASNSIGSTDFNSSSVCEADDGNQDGKRELTPLRDDPKYRYVPTSEFNLLRQIRFIPHMLIYIPVANISK